MKMKYKVLAASIAIAVSGQALAALDLPSTNNGSLWLTVWDTSIGATKSYHRDLGVNVNDFLPSNITAVANDGGVTGNKTPEAGLNISFASDATWTTFLSGLNLANLAWNVVGSDSGLGGAVGQARLLVTQQTTQVAAPAVNKNAVNTAAGRGNTAGTDLNNNWGCGTSASCIVTDPSAQGYGNSTGLWGDRLGNALPATAGTSGAVGSLLNFFYFAINGTGATNADVRQAFANTTGRATMQLAADGSLTYNLEGPAAVPVPAAVWLLGSGLVGLVGVARRRNQAAA